MAKKCIEMNCIICRNFIAIDFEKYESTGRQEFQDCLNYCPDNEGCKNNSLKRAINQNNLEKQEEELPTEVKQTFHIKSHGVKAEVVISEPLYSQDLQNIAEEIEIFNEYFWSNPHENWIGVCDNIQKYIEDFQERHEYIKNIKIISEIFKN
jgi:hypothetical protein